MSHVGFFLAAVLAKMFDPLILAAGILPPLASNRAATLLASCLLGAGLGTFVYVVSRESGYPVSVVTIPICAMASTIWWAFAFALRRLFTQLRAR